MVKLPVMFSDLTSQMSSPLNDWISLDVGGTLFKTRRSTLVSVPGSLLANMFDPESDMLPARQENGAYIIDAPHQVTRLPCKSIV